MIRTFFFTLTLVLTSISAALTSERPKYYCVQVVSVKNVKVAKKLLHKLNEEPDARIERRGKYYTVRVGYFKTREEAQKELIKIKRITSIPDVYVRTCLYNPKTIVAIANNGFKKDVLSSKSSKKRNKERKKTNNLKSQSRSPQVLLKKKEGLFYLYMEKAKICMGKKDCSMAVEYLKKAIKENPKDPKPYVYLGYAYLHLKEFDKALKAFQQALLINPSYSEGYEALGYFYLKLNNPKAAEIFLKKAYELKPDNIYYGVNYAIALMELGKYDSAEKVFSSIKTRFPFIPEIYFNEALLYLKKGDIAKATKDLETFISLTEGINRYKQYTKKAKLILKTISRIKSEKRTNSG